jgi:hypothetical protein
LEGALVRSWQAARLSYARETKNSTPRTGLDLDLSSKIVAARAFMPSFGSLLSLRLMSLHGRTFVARQLSGFLADLLAAGHGALGAARYEVGNDFQVARLKAVGVKPLLNMNSIHRAPEQAPAVRAGARREHNYGSSKGLRSNSVAGSGRHYQPLCRPRPRVEPHPDGIVAAAWLNVCFRRLFANECRRSSFASP